MQRTKKVLSLVLSLVMVLTMIPVISLNFTEPVKAYSSYSKQKSTEYYYASGTQFIYQLILYYSSSSNDAARNWLTNNGWTDWSGNFNAGDGDSDSKYIHSGYKTTTDPTVAIKGILVADGHPTSVSYGGCTYYAVGSGSIAQTPTGGDGMYDLNKGNGGDDLYLMATADYNAGPALTSITKSQSGSASTAQNNLTNNGYRIVTDQSGNYQDTNAGAGGDYNYCGQKSSCTTVNSDSLREAYLSAKNRYENGGSGISGLSTALNTASNILSDLNDGYTTYTQAQINSATQALNWAVASVSVNSATTFTVSSANTGAYGLYAFTPSSTGKYVFLSNASVDTKGWIYTKDTSSSIGLSQITNGYNDDVGSGSDQYTILGLNHYYNHYVKDVTLNAGTTYYLRTQYYSSQAGNYPIYICNAVDLNFYPADNASEVKTYTNFPAGFSFPLTKVQTLFTRSGFTLLGWSNNSSNIARMESRDYTPTQSFTIPTSSTNFAALWSPSSPTTVNANTAYTATISKPYTIQYYKFTPSTTRKYKFYATGSGLDTYGVMYEQSAWANSAAILDYDDDAAGNSQFAKTRQLTAGTAYLLGVKCYSANVGSVPFRIDEIYNITYNANGGSGEPSAQEKQYGVSLTLSSDQPTRAGYTFRGWATSSTATSAGYAAGGSYTANADAVLYAVWAGNPYSVVFNGNNATSGSMSNQSFIYGTAQNLNANAFSRKYTVTYKYNNGLDDGSATATATFNGWATTASGAKVYNNQQSVNNLTTTNNGSVPLFANWTLGTVTLPTPTRAGYTFKGWYKEAACTTLAGNGGAIYTPTASTTLYAKWEAADNTITFNANGGTAVPQLSYKITDSKTLPSTAKDGYVFNNWKVTTAAGNWSANATFSAGASVNGKYGNPTLTAQYTPTNYTITYNVDGATSTAQYNIESTAKLPSQSKTGYDFAGWAISSNTGNWTETGNLPADTALSGRWGDVTLTARWTPKTYGISYTLGDGASAANQPLSVEYDGSYTFTVTVDEAHDQNMPEVTATGATVSQTVNGNVITVTLSNVTGEVAVNVPTAINTYSFTLNGDEGFTSDDRAQTVDYGATVSFTVNLSDGYTQTAPTVKQGDTPLDPKTVNGSAYTYEIENVTSDITVNVTATLNVYNVSFDETNGASFADVEGAAIDIDNSVPATHGAPFRFSVTLAEGYTQTAPVVKVNGSTLAFASKTGDHTYNYEIESVTGAVEIETITTLNTYTVTWKNENGSEIKQTTVTHGSVPAYDGEEPTKASDDNYDYVFGGWNPVPVAANADASYTVVFTPQVREYAVKFVNEDGTVLQNEILPYGAMPEYKGSDPVKAATAQYTYTFKGWDNEIVTVTGPVTYTATFNATVNKYTVRFVNDGVQLQSEELEYGATPEFKGETP